jgi:hypothetical protein
MIESFLYLTATRPDIQFSVCLCSCFQASPRTLHRQAEGLIRQQERGSELELIKNSYRRRSKLQQDELARSDTQNHTLRTSTFCLPKPRSYWSDTGSRNKHYQQPRLLHGHGSGNNIGVGRMEGAV